jgi:hypothetical protein
MTSNNTFSFTNGLARTETLSTGRRIRITSLDKTIARVDFVDKSGAGIGIPSGYTMVGVEAREPLPSFAGSYLIVWYADYDLKHLGRVVFSFRNTKELLLSHR